jgi:two-component system, cell cycle sensor histidine kinase and response regulator CckA
MNSSAVRLKYRMPLFLLLVVAGLAGNYFKFPIFLNIDFLFGSIFAMLALQIFGKAPGILAGALIASVTWLLWNHPYAILIMTAELIAVGWLMQRYKIGMVLADTFYWLIIGMPLVFLFYHLIMHVPLTNTMITMTKQAVNGISNALLARLIFTGFALRFHTSRISYRELIYNMLAFFVLCPALIVLTIDSRTDYNLSDQNIRNSLRQNHQITDNTLEEWVVNRKTAIINLADMAAARTAPQMQPYLELANKSDANFLRIGLLDKAAITTAFFPLQDELGQSNIGKNFADRPFIPALKQTLKPMLSEVVMGRLGKPKPMVTMLAPVLINGAYGGYITGILSLEQIRANLDLATKLNATYYTLLDKTGNIIMTNRSDQAIMKPLLRGKGSIHRLDDAISQWVPEASPNTPISERWKNSFYISESSIGDLAEWKLVLEQPVAPFQKQLYDNYTGKLILLFVILLGALVLAEYLSRKAIGTLEVLGLITNDLPARLAKVGNVISWPESNMQESSNLINNFKVMAESLTAQFKTVRESNMSLEKRVEERTNELKQQQAFLHNSEERLRLATSAGGIAIWDCDLQSNILIWDDAMYAFYGVKREDFCCTFDAWQTLIHPEDQPRMSQEIQQALQGSTTFDTEFRVIHPDGKVHYLKSLGEVFCDEQGKPVRIAGVNLDITERRKSEQERNQLLEIIKDAPDFIATSDMQGHLKFLNKAGARIVGLPVDVDLSNLQIKDMHSVLATKRVLEEGIPAVLEQGFWLSENTLRHRDGHEVPVSQLLMLHRDASNNPLMLSTIMRDISDSKEYEAGLKRSNAELEQFSYAVSHDMRQPLRMISSYLQLLEMSLAGKLENEQRDYFNFAIDGAKRIDQMLVALLEYSRIGRMGEPPTLLDSRSMLDEALLFLQPAIAEAQAQIEICGEWPRMMASRDELTRLLQNLIGNAVKYRIHGRIPEITVSSETIDHEWRFSVADNGVGINPSQIPRLFKVFQRLHTRDAYEGTGIGLALCRKIVEHHKGRIWAESAGEEMGSSFCVVLPNTEQP